VRDHIFPQWQDLLPHNTSKGCPLSSRKSSLSPFLLQIITEKVACPLFYLIKGEAKDKIGLEINLLGQGGTK